MPDHRPVLQIHFSIRLKIKRKQTREFNLQFSNKQSFGQFHSFQQIFKSRVVAHASFRLKKESFDCNREISIRRRSCPAQSKPRGAERPRPCRNVQTARCENAS